MPPELIQALRADIFGTVAVLLATFAGLLLGVKCLHATSRARRKLRRARRAIGRLTRVLRPAERALTRPLESLRRHSAPSVRRQRAQDLTQAPIEALRDVGVSNIRWSAFEAAGMTTLGDLEGWTGRRLQTLEGIGAKSAQEVVTGCRALSARIASEPPRPPTPELTERDDPDIARRCLEVLRTRDALSVVRPLSGRRDELEARRDALAAESGVLRWLVSALSPNRRRGWEERAEALEADTRTVLEGESLRIIERERAELSRSWRPLDREEIARAFADRYAECSAVFEEAHVGEVRSGLGSALAPDLLRRIEAQELRIDGLRLTLRGYQAFGARFMLAQGRTLLGDEMGLGKTIQALAAAVHLSSLDPATRIAVVMPASLLHQWARETRTHTDLRVLVAHGSRKNDAVSEWLAEGGVLAVSYATLRTLDLADRLDTANRRVDLTVADEAHYAKNPEAKRTRALTDLLDRSERRCLMTGTPLENHPDEFQRILSLIDPTLESRTERGRHDLAVGFLDPEVFRRRVAEVYLRRTQRDVLSELPERLEIDEWVELGPVERTAYRAAVEAGEFMGMRQRATLAPDGTSAKLDLLAELLEEHREEGRKVIVFSYFLDILRACADRFAAVGTIHGGQTPAKRDALISEFRDAPDGAILCGQIVAAGVGLNLQFASAVILVEPQLKPALEAQAIARAHRMGQTRKLLVHRLLAEDTIDGRLRDLLAAKAELFERYVEGSLLEAASGDAEDVARVEDLLASERARVVAARGNETDTVDTSDRSD